MLRNLRSRGILPHAYGEDADEAVAAWVVELRTEFDTIRAESTRLAALDGDQEDDGSVERLEAGSAKDAGAGAGAGVIPDEAEDEGGDEVEPSPRLGINRPKTTRFRDTDVAVETQARFGTTEQILLDVARTGAGFVRQVEKFDLLWWYLFPNEAIPAPAELYEKLTESDFEPLEHFTALLVAAGALGIQVVPTLFTMAGGQDRQNGVDTSGMDGPSHHPDLRRSIVVPSAQGWDPFYYLFGNGTGRQELFQASGLNVYSPQGGYMGEAAVRKCLGLAAFGTAIGEYFQALDDALASEGGLAAYVPIVEVGNEVDLRWLPTGTTGDAGSMALEWARFHTVLATAVRLECPTCRFRFAELGSHPDRDQWRTAIDWLADAIAGVDASLGLLQSVVTSREILEAIENSPKFGSIGTAAGLDEVALYEFLEANASEEVVFWLDAIDASGFAWPPEVDATVGDLVHGVGLHWYAFADPGPSSNPPYTGDKSFLRALRTMKSRVISPFSSQHGRTLALSVSEIGFPALNTPSNFGDVVWRTSTTSPGMQAGMLVRLMLLARVSEVERAGWHTHMSGILGMSREERDGLEGDEMFYSEGLGNDVARKFVDDFRADEQAYRRPSWFSYRRVALLLSEADEVELVHAGTSAFVVRLVASTRFSLGAFYARRQAYVLWVDQIDAREDWSFSFEGSTRWRQVSLVPTVEPSLGSPPVQNGYAAGEDVDRSPERTCTASVSSTSSGIAAVLHPADPKENPAPLCIFTDAELTGISAGRILSESSSTTEGRWWTL